MSLTGKGTLSLKKKDVKESNVPALGFKKVEWKHAPTVDDEFIDLTALVTPAEATANGFVQPSLSELTSVNLKQFKTNFQLQSSARGLMADSIDYVVVGSTRIRLIVPALAGELFSGHIDENAKTGVTFADQVALSITGTLALGATDFNVGQAFPVAKFPSSQHGAVLIYADGQLMFRNTGNNPLGAGVTGDYREVPAGAGLSVLIRFNSPDLAKDRNISVVANGAIVEAPNGSQLQLIENLAGQIDLMVPSLAQLAGVPETDFQGAPNDVDLKAFGDRVLQNETDIASNETDIASNVAAIAALLPLKVQTQKYDTRAGFGSTNTVLVHFTNNTLSDGSGLFTPANSTTFGNSFTILKDCLIIVSYSNSHSSTGEEFGISKNASGTQLTDVGAYSAAPHTVRMAMDHSNGNKAATCCIATIGRVGDVFRAHNNNTSNLGPADDVSVLVTAIAFDEG